MTEKVVILSTARTPIGKYKGSLAEFSAVQLGAIAAESAIEKAGISADCIQQTIVGNVLSAGNGQNVARQIALNNGLPESSTAMTINEVCGSGMKALILAMQQIQLGEAQVVLAGGTESMTQAPLLQKYQASTQTYSEPVASMFLDGLTDAFSNQLMGVTAEHLAKKYQISRSQQDQYAFTSQKKAAAARLGNKFTAEITPIKLASGEYLTQDEGFRENTSLEKLSTLKTVFKEQGSVTAGNASTVNDGAAMMILASKSYVDEHHLPYLATIEGFSEVGVDPQLMGVAPITAIQNLLAKKQLTLNEIDLFEINEAFAVASLAIEEQLQLPAEKVNIYGGAIALGHPIGASGTRIVATLISQLIQEQKTIGIASLCIGGGLGLALLIKKNTQSITDEPAKKFYQLTPEERRQQLFQQQQLTAEEVNLLTEMTSLSPTIAANMIENQVGQVEIPLGVAPNFLINQQNYFVPMATEEASVIAAASNGAKLVANSGGFTATQQKRLMRGQIVFQQVKDFAKIQKIVAQQQAELLQQAQASYPSIVKRGGGVRQITLRQLADDFASLDVLVDTQDAMGANIINTILEGLAQYLQNLLPEETLLFSILSNLPTEALTTVTCKIPTELLATKQLSGLVVAEKIAAASTYAQLDPYRAATHNKGIMNGIDAVVLATGNDTRAIAAGCHAFAAIDGQYRSLATWQVIDQHLVGSLTLPLAVGTVGGATKMLPKAQIALHLLKNPDANQLAAISAAVGLAQNLAALKALVTEGIQKGHMNLHMRSLAISAGASSPEEIKAVTQQLQANSVKNLATAQDILKKIRKI
ncbi:hydroxymethylglutaryl-CoA reductase [Enterococcus sp. PF1-24]|uniref:hydroxymethylglutaryl-CoA reductase, degradative n=1 Tax=unclassified Enterococcus TaxID=2608891 RepID=UPI00247437C1|nr:MULTISPECIES: hydroxymethylglutaryl-CoA reductase, degradative [unclassified Enterococcus]MDH6363798.1 hydroxymethylglutaryl-CoA reductase [Enterococcus sp. PFB1-1]MDH6400754.1 hydroxymethylglutaryl-CoA reductase [Enterococcus sp. PF1-24]